MTIDYHHHLTVFPLLTNIYNAPNLNIISLRKLLRHEIVDSMGRHISLGEWIHTVKLELQIVIHFDYPELFL